MVRRKTNNFFSRTKGDREFNINAFHAMIDQEQEQIEDRESAGTQPQGHHREGEFGISGIMRRSTTDSLALTKFKEPVPAPQHNITRPRPYSISLNRNDRLIDECRNDLRLIEPYTDAQINLRKSNVRQQDSLVTKGISLVSSDDDGAASSISESLTEFSRDKEVLSERNLLHHQTVNENSTFARPNRMI